MQDNEEELVDLSEEENGVDYVKERIRSALRYHPNSTLTILNTLIVRYHAGWRKIFFEMIEDGEVVLVSQLREGHSPDGTRIVTVYALADQHQAATA
jgi:hypothetical protein